MSLTSQIDYREGPVRRFFDERLPHVRAIQRRFRESGVPTILPEGDRPPWSEIGMAFDYRLRYGFGLTPPSRLVAARGALLLGAGSVNSGGSGAYAHLAAGLRAFLKESNPVGRLLPPRQESRLARFCYVLGLYETCFRNAAARATSPLLRLDQDASTADQLALAPHEAVADLCQLADAFIQSQRELLRRPAVLNPTFNLSLAVGGADADLIIDGCLIELKTTKRPKLPREWIYQLVGYALLDDIDCYDIDRVGFYLSRVPTLLTWELPDLIAEMAERPVELDLLRADFRSILAEAGELHCKG